MAKYDSTIFGEARSETAHRRSGRTERIIRNESSADFLSAVSQPVRQAVLPAKRQLPRLARSSVGNSVVSGKRPSGLRPVLPPTRPAAVAYRFRSERPATSSYDRRTSLLISLSGTSRSKRTLIQCRLFSTVAGPLYTLVAVPQIDRLVRVALQTAEIELADMDETEPFVPHAEHEQFPVVLRGRFVERHLVACARGREAVCPEFFYVHFGSSESACQSAFLMRGPSCRSLRTNFFGAGNASGDLPRRTGPRGSRDQDTLPFSVRTWRSPGGWLRPRPGSRSCRLRRSTGRYGTRTIRRAGCRDRARNTRS